MQASRRLTWTPSLPPSHRKSISSFSLLIEPAAYLSSSRAAALGLALLVFVGLVGACAESSAPSLPATSPGVQLCNTYSRLIAVRPLVVELLATSTFDASAASHADQVFETLKTFQDLDPGQWTGTPQDQLAAHTSSATIELVNATGEIGQSIRQEQAPPPDSLTTLRLGSSDLDAAQAANDGLARQSAFHC